MAGKKNSGPLLFAEWVIGTPLPRARRALKPEAKPKAAAQREVIRIEVTTDDEKEEDTLKVTFPRSGRAAASTAAIDEKVGEAVVKRVRFEDDKKEGAKKSAMKQQQKGDDSDSSATLADSSSDGESSEAGSAKEDKNSPSSEESDSTGEKTPVCKCSRCAKKRNKGGKNEKSNKEAKSASDSEDSGSDSTASKEDEKGKEKNKSASKKQDNNGNSQSKSKNKNKQKDTKKNDSSDTGDEESGSGKETTTDEEKDTNNEKTKESSKQDKKKENKSAKGKKNETETETTKSSEKKNNANDNSNKPPASQFRPLYPEVFPGPHPRRPNLIGPIRAQVVQTEPVVETPEDPPPNAFYDAASNIVRVYYGPVYGNHNPYQQSLYPKRDPAHAALPVGMPHPTQNPYYYGFQHQPGSNGQNGMPPGADWSRLFVQPPGFPPFVANPMQQPQPQPQQQQQQQDGAAQYGGKGAFSKKSAGSAPSVTQAEDPSGRSNVLPASKIDEKKTTSPYYTPSKTAADLRNGSHHNGPGKAAALVETWDSNNANNQNDNAASWDNNAPAAGQDGNTWGDGAGASNNNDGGNWNQDASDWNQNAGNGDANTWDNNGTGNGNSGGGDNTWGDNNNNNNSSYSNDGYNNGANSGNTGDNWGDNNAANGNGNDAPPAETSNVMPDNLPGAWQSAPEPTPAWGDASMAASTNGAAVGW